MSYIRPKFAIRAGIAVDVAVALETSALTTSFG